MASDAEDAAKWRALINCARISTMGSAGLMKPSEVEGYAHLTVNLWTIHSAPSDQLALDWLNKFVDMAIQVQKKNQV